MCEWHPDVLWRESQRWDHSWHTAYLVFAVASTERWFYFCVCAHLLLQMTSIKRSTALVNKKARRRGAAQPVATCLHTARKDLPTLSNRHSSSNDQIQGKFTVRLTVTCYKFWNSGTNCFHFYHFYYYKSTSFFGFNSSSKKGIKLFLNPPSPQFFLPVTPNCLKELNVKIPLSF